jgi:hypothetical protein
MQIVINHLTRMQKGFMCAAGVDPATGRHVRPVLASQMRTEMLARHGGPFELGYRVELGETKFVGKVPEIEDRQFEAAAAQRLDRIPPAEFWNLLTELAADGLAEIFGPDLQPLGAASCGVFEFHGLRSLGCYWARNSSIHLQTAADQTRIRFAFEEGARRYSVPVTDIRLYGEDHVTPDADAVDALARTLAGRQRVLVSVGLSRAYKRSDDNPAVHWLQVNNIHLPPEAAAEPVPEAGQAPYRL